MQTILSYLAQTGLFFGQPITWALIGLLGLLVISRPAFGRALLLVFFSMIFNPLLKFWFQEPLPEPMDGWAFPSGHMQAAIVFWGWLAIEAKGFWPRFLLGVLLLIIAYGVIYSGYHYPRDVIGAICVGALMLVAYHALNQLKTFKDKPYWVGLPLIALSLIIMIAIPPEGFKIHMMQGLGGLVGITFGWKFAVTLDPNPRPTTLFEKIILLILGFIGILGCQWVISHNMLPAMHPLNKFAQTCAMTLWATLLPVGLKRR